MTETHHDSRLTGVPAVHADRGAPLLAAERLDTVCVPPSRRPARHSPALDRRAWADPPGLPVVTFLPFARRAGAAEQAGMRWQDLGPF
ncbi:hypothetical protein OK074_4771 [Actinobacteria bacterium OK074]|nr:hypothetical protein OK074_4771 [Actinobacteria bacterium OK074]